MPDICKLPIPIAPCPRGLAPMVAGAAPVSTTWSRRRGSLHRRHPVMARKTHLIDKVPWWQVVILALGYLVSLAICVGVGGAGPAPLVVVNPAPLSPSSVLTCPDPSDCIISARTTITDLSPYNQAIWLRAFMSRPWDASRNQSALLSASFSFPVQYRLTVTGTDSSGGTVILSNNVTHGATFTCPPFQPTCGSALVLAQAFLYYSQYTIHMDIDTPLQPFIDAGIPFTNFGNTTANGIQVGITIRGAYLSRQYTQFQLSGKYTFFVLSVLMVVFYFVFLYKGAGAKHPVTGALLPSSMQQQWVAALGILLVWYNDPTFAVIITKPNIAAAAYYAVCAAGFYVTLAVWFLVSFDMAQGGDGEGRTGMTAHLSRRCHCSAVAAAFWFWLPKLLWAVVAWVLMVSYWVATRVSWLTDPASDLFATYPLLARYFTDFLFAWGGIYVVYLVVLMLISCYNCRTVAPSSRFTVAITVISIIAILVGYFGQSAVAVNASNSSIIFMASTGAANLYVWFLMIAYLPSKPASQADLVDKVDAAGSGQGDVDGVDLTLYARRPTVEVSTDTADLVAFGRGSGVGRVVTVSGAWSPTGAGVVDEAAWTGGSGGAGAVGRDHHVVADYPLPAHDEDGGEVVGAGDLRITMDGGGR